MSVDVSAVTPNVAAQVRAAAAELVAAFGRHESAAYFDCFLPEATFVFHNHATRLTSRAEYRRLWDRWEREDGFRVISCESSGQRVQVFGDSAVFEHEVRTTVRTGLADAMVESVSHERETIVFVQRDGRWLAAHEHLSARPAEI